MTGANRQTADAARIEKCLASLVAFDTQNPPGDEQSCAQYIGDYLADLGCTVRFDEILPGRPNVIGTFENGDGPTFALNIHMDVVAFGDGWTSDPTSLTARDDTLVARGACDAKGPLAAMLEAMRLLIDDAQSWRGRLMGVFVVDEEAESRGAKAFAESGEEIDYCIIGEPTSCEVVTAHKGSMRPLVRVHGVSAHSASPQLGVNAILKSAPLLERIEAEHARLQAQSHPLVGNPSLTVTRSWGGHANNAVPEAADFLLDRRLIPGEADTEVQDQLRQLVGKAATAAGVDMEIVKFKPTTGGATETSADHPLVVAAQHVVARYNGRTTEIGGFQGGCDLVHFAKMGAAGVIVGPGSIAVAHKPNEFVPRDELARSADIYRDIVAEMLPRS